MGLKFQGFQFKLRLQESENSPRVSLRVFDGISTVQESHFLQEHCSVLRFFRDLKLLIGVLWRGAFKELDDHRVTRVNFEDLHGTHSKLGLPMAISLSTHDSFHICGVTVFGTGDDGWSRHFSVRNLHIHDRCSVQTLQPCSERLKFLLVEFLATCGQVFVLFTILQLDVVCSNVFEVFAIEATSVIHHVFVNRIHKEKNFYSFFVERLEELRLLHIFNAVTCNVVDFFLPIFHVLNIFVQRSNFSVGCRTLVKQQLHKFTSVRFVFDDTHLNLRSKLKVPFCVFVSDWCLGFLVFLAFVRFCSDSSSLVFGFLFEILQHFECLSDHLFLNNLDNPRFLECLTIDIQGQIVAIDNTLHEVEIAGQHIKCITDQHLLDIEAEPVGIMCLYSVKHFLRSILWKVQD
mmetsp:Transcript_6030/g.17153  ORF Transcript_6030/g.17153 Transcript_6030/m.17153 type:complete len:404 (-) Transcript_6030:1282-2493(-)